MSSPSGVGNLNQRPIQIVAGVVVVVDFLKFFVLKLPVPLTQWKSEFRAGWTCLPSFSRPGARIALTGYCQPVDRGFSSLKLSFRPLTCHFANRLGSVRLVRLGQIHPFFFSCQTRFG